MNLYQVAEEIMGRLAHIFLRDELRLAAGLWGNQEVSRGPALARLSPVLRELPRRQRGRSRYEPPGRIPESSPGPCMSLRPARPSSFSNWARQRGSRKYRRREKHSPGEKPKERERIVGGPKYRQLPGSAFFRMSLRFHGSFWRNVLDTSARGVMR